MKKKKEKKKQEKLREERKLKIIAKIIREINDDVLSRRPKYICSKRHKIKQIASVGKTYFEEIRDEELAIVEKDESFSLMEEQVAEESEKDEKIEDLRFDEDEKDDKTKKKGDEIILKKIVLKKPIKTPLKQTFPKDTCFYATPSVVIIEVLDLFSKFLNSFKLTSIASV